MPVMPVMPVMTAVVPDNTTKSDTFLAMPVMTAVMTAVVPDNTTKSDTFLAMAMTAVMTAAAMKGRLSVYAFPEPFLPSAENKPSALFSEHSES
jgi:hypothetical protein